MNSGVLTGAGPGGRRVARLCLLQYGAANAAPIRPEAAKEALIQKCRRPASHGRE